MFCNVFSAENKIGSFAFCRRQVGMCDFSFFIHFGKDLLTFISTMKLLPKPLPHTISTFSFCFPSVNNGLNRLAIIGI